MSWGNRIALIFIGFVALIVSLVTLCMRQKDIHLVTEKYYEKEITYQKQIDIENNTAALKEKPTVAYSNETVTVHYPFAGPVTGKILFFRPSDATLDFTIPVDAVNRQQVISVADLKKGLWKIKMEWLMADKKFYFEERLVVL